MDLEYIAFSQLIQSRQETNRPYYQFIDDEIWSAGLYFLEAGAKDEQNPHQLDEIYYVIQGKSKFVAGVKETNVYPGSILFVKAEIGHKFFDITEDLQVLVIFTKNNSQDASDFYFSERGYEGVICDYQNLSVSISDTILNKGFAVLLEGSLNAKTEQGNYEINAPGLAYVRSISEIKFNEVKPIRILTVTNK